jgi:dienelactone hydrolase
MRTLARSLVAFACAAMAGVAAVGAQADAQLWQVRKAGDGFDDGRVAAARDLDRPAAFTPVFANRDAWLARAEVLRRQVRVALGLWPWPERTPLNVSVRGKVERDGYTVEQVAFESVPGHVVTGSLYRPTGRRGKRPVVLAPHGHFPGGRHQERSVEEAQKSIDSGAEQTMASARFPLQARPAMLAKMGAIVFAWDVIGYADSTRIEHRTGFTDADGEQRLESFLGLQMWNAVRAVDWLVTLPDADTTRIGVNGASGGGTQSLLLSAIDDRIATSVPAVMVSGNMQGGCVCENGPLLRIGTNNIELTALTAPRPLAAVAANDWTHDFMTKGLPELKTIYGLFGKPDAVAGVKFEFPHNDNQVSREYAYAWFNKVFALGAPEPVRETPFVPVLPSQLRVFGDGPRPPSERDAAGVRAAMRAGHERQMKALAATPGMLEPMLRAGFAAAIGDTLPAKVDPVPGSFRPVHGDGFTVHQSVLARPGGVARMPAIGIVPKGWAAGPVVVWLHEQGKRAAFDADGRTPSPEVKQLLAGGAAVLVPDVFLTGEAGAIANRIRVKNDETYFGYNTGYNRTVLAERAADVLTAIQFAKQLGGRDVAIAGRGQAALWGLAALPFAGNAVARSALDVAGFDFDQVREVTDERLLPGAVKYGGIRGLASLAAHGRTTVFGAPQALVAPWVPLPAGVRMSATSASAEALMAAALTP